MKIGPLMPKLSQKLKWHTFFLRHDVGVQMWHAYAQLQRDGCYNWFIIHGW